VTNEKHRLVTFRVGWLLVAIGLACGLAAGLMLAVSVGPALKDAFLRHSCATPCSELLDLDAGRYLVFEQTGHTTSAGPVTSTEQSPTTITPTDVAVTSSTGRALEVTHASASETINRNGDIYASVVSFHVPESGRYRVSVDAPDETRILIAPGIGQTLVRALPGAAVASLGFAVGAAGVAILIVAWVRRRNEPKAT
jgi:hypothetical protein